MALKPTASTIPPLGGSSAGASTTGTSSNSNATVFNDLLVKALEQADARLNELSKASDAPAKSAKLPQVENAIKEAQQMKKSFVMEISLMKPAEKAPFRSLQENYEAHLLKIEQTLKLEKAWLDKSMLTGGKNDKGLKPTQALDANDARDQLLKETMSIQGKMGESLIRTRQKAAETVHIGTEVADALEGQKDQIIRIDQGVTEVDDEIKRANQIMAAIFRRMATDKLVICCSFIMFSLIIVVIALVSTGTIVTAGRRLR